MTTPTREHVQKMWNAYHNAYQISTNDLASGKVPPEYLYFGIGTEARDIAIYNIVFREIVSGSKAEALKWFERAVENFLKKGFAWRHPGDRRGDFGYKDGRLLIYLHALETAALSRNQLLMKLAAEPAADLPESDVPVIFQYTASGMANVILRRDEKALHYAEKIDALSPSSHKRVGYYPGIGKSLKGIVATDGPLLLRGIAEMIERHKHMASGKSTSSPEIAICLPATALLLIAKDRELDVHNEYQTKYIPALLFEDPPAEPKP